MGRGTEALTRARTDQVVGTALVYSSSTASACVIVDGLIFLHDLAHISSLVLSLLTNVCFFSFLNLIFVPRICYILLIVIVHILNL